MESYRSLKATRAGDVEFAEPQLNALGYQLLARGRTAEAIAIFRLNAEDYPQSWNVHDSLGEAYLKDGQRELAIASYRRSLELNGENQGARDALKKLEVPEK